MYRAGRLEEDGNFLVLQHELQEETTYKSRDVP